MELSFILIILFQLLPIWVLGCLVQKPFQNQFQSLQSVGRSQQTVQQRQQQNKPEPQQLQQQEIIPSQLQLQGLQQPQKHETFAGYDNQLQPPTNLNYFTIQKQRYQNQDQYQGQKVTTSQGIGIRKPIEKCPPQNPETNKALVITFYQRAVGDLNLENLENYLRDDYIQHNPQIADGIEGFREAFRTGPLQFLTRMKIDFKRVSAVDDLVWVHTRFPQAGRNFAVIDIFRVQCGKIAEHWDVIQEIDAQTLRTAKNSRPFF